ncbi:RNA polymerase sigma factor [Sorangium atrum]|uniref:Sigma-70 family RNA polymerase sigma factor n=1 Tax=Sorangium atrum TaxID=2995308 RepID=A0ABT5C992_9BACT|nr:sigma-70 family RNA polymerase sigma factor [Sorangium aterium]MDC0683010.1 sigma-70 family RNA polymerase sigma factor [Sorangium aterium]
MRGPAADLDAPPEGAPPRADELLGLARAAAARDPAAIRTLVTELGGAMLRSVRKVLGPRHPDVEDTTQEAVLALLQALPSFRAECTVLHFANRIAVMTALGARRRLRVRARFDEPGAPIDVAPDEGGASPFAEAVSNRRREMVLQVLDGMPEATAEALALHFVLGYTVDEIAALAGASPNTVWSRLRLGKEALRRAFANNAKLAELFRGRET